MQLRSIDPVITWLYRVLPMVFGCHCRDDRSFHWKGRRFPICARCTGELLGVVLAAVGFAFWHPGVRPAALLLIPMVLDGGMQQATAYESTNFRRLVTGMLFGYGIFSLFLRSMVWTFRFGFSLGKQWFG